MQATICDLKSGAGYSSCYSSKRSSRQSSLGSAGHSRVIRSVTSEVIGCTEQGMKATKPPRGAKLGRASAICFSILCAGEGSHFEGTTIAMVFSTVH